MRRLIPFLLLFLLAAAGCTPAVAPATPTPSPTRTPRPTSTPVPADPIDDTEALSLLEDLGSGQVNRQQAAVDRVLAARDQRFTGVFIEMYRINQLGLDPAPLDYWPQALERLTGQEFGLDWAEWIEWYGRTSLEPPPGFVTWKGELLARIDERFADFFPAGAPAGNDLRPEEIVWGGVVVDGIPALDNPAHLPATDAGYLLPEEPVFGIALNGDARAYPLRILDWHEMANDVVGGVPISLAYCTLCGAAIAYDGRASDGMTYDFGSSGLLYRSNKLMYDRQTNTLWNQLTGRPVLGELVERDVRLDLLPVVLTSWAQWQAQHPDTVVLDLETGYDRPYEPGAAYGTYFAGEETMFPVWRRSDLLETKARIYALTIEGQPKAYPLDVLTAAGVVNDELAGQELVLVAGRGTVTVAGEDRRAGPVAYEAGGEVRAYARNGHTFTPGDNPDEVVDETGAVWQVTEAALLGPDGEELPRIGGHLAYWFGWYAFFPNTAVYE